MEFASGVSIDVKDWRALQMRREINPFTYRPATNVDRNGTSTNTITTSLGIVLPKTGAGSEYGREQKEALKRKRYATKGTNLEDLPWLLTDRSSNEKKLKHYRGMKKGGVTSNSSYYVFVQSKDGFEAHPVEDWYAFTPTNVYKTLDFDEAEKQYQERHKNLNKWFLKHQITKKKEGDAAVEEENGDEKGKKSKSKTKRDFKLLDVDDWVEEKDDEEDDDDDNQDNEDEKKSKTKQKNEKKVKGAWTLSDEEEEETEQMKMKKHKMTKRQTSEEQQGEDSDDGDHEGDEIEYTSDETSEEEDDIKDVGTAKAEAKYEVRGVDEEIKTMPDIEKKLEQLEENGDELDLDDDDEEEDIPDIDDNADENKTAAADLSAVGNLLKGDLKEIESSSDDDDIDDSDDPEKETIEPINAPINTQPIPSEQVKTEKGHKKAREEEMRAIKSKVMSLPSTPAHPTETITEEKVRSLLLRKQAITFTELIQVFLPKTENLRTKEVKDGIVRKLAAVLKRLNIEEKTINGKKHIKLKST